MTHDAARRLVAALAAAQGIICAVGAGGKKSTLRRLMTAHAVLGTPSVAWTATVLVAPPAPDAAIVTVIDDPDRLPAAIDGARAHSRQIIYATPSAKPGRLGGVPGELIQRLHEERAFTVTLVKADGARMRLIKAPAPLEPVLPPQPAVVIPIVSASAIGRPLDERIAHRPERLLEVVGAAMGDELRPVHLARLLASPKGALQHAGSATVVPLINAVDDPGRLRVARLAAAAALEMSGRFPRVVLATMIARDPIVEIVQR